MSLKHGLLGILNYTPMTGYDLDKSFKVSLSFFWQATTSQVYRELNAMEKAGWLTSEWVLQTDKPNKRVYSITDAGREELQRWMRISDADIQAAMHVRSAFLMRIFFAGANSREESIQTLREYRRKCEESQEKMKTAYAAIEDYGGLVNNDQRADYWRITAMYGDEYYRAGLAWADKAIELLQQQED